MDLLTYENEYFARGYAAVAGVDEVGRGPLAGPVVCAAVVLPREEALRVAGVDDSKKLSKKKREALAERIREVARAYNIVEIDAETIDEINILQATRLGMKRAVEGLKIADFVSRDPQKALVYSIGAASILAKVYRDALMCRFDGEFPEYGFCRNVGYGTAEHIAAIREYGICKIHRKTFVKKFWDGRERT